MNDFEKEIAESLRCISANIDEAFSNMEFDRNHLLTNGKEKNLFITDAAVRLMASMFSSQINEDIDYRALAEWSFSGAEALWGEARARGYSKDEDEVSS